VKVRLGFEKSLRSPYTRGKRYRVVGVPPRFLGSSRFRPGDPPVSRTDAALARTAEKSLRPSAVGVWRRAFDERERQSAGNAYPNEIIFQCKTLRRILKASLSATKISFKIFILERLLIFKRRRSMDA
jgi:hypothetical protein